MDSRTGSGRGKLHLIGIRLGVGDELLHRADRKVLAHDQHQRCFQKQADAREIPGRVVGRLLVERLVLGLRSHGAEQEGVAIGLGLRDPVGAVHAAGATDILDDHGLSQDFAHPLRKQPCRHVVGAARGEGIDHGECARRPVLRP
jgi:hypothetical protein